VEYDHLCEIESILASRPLGPEGVLFAPRYRLILLIGARNAFVDQQLRLAHRGVGEALG